MSQTLRSRFELKIDKGTPPPPQKKQKQKKQRKNKTKQSAQPPISEA